MCSIHLVGFSGRQILNMIGIHQIIVPHIVRFNIVNGSMTVRPRSNRSRDTTAADDSKKSSDGIALTVVHPNTLFTTK